MMNWLVILAVVSAALGDQPKTPLSVLRAMRERVYANWDQREQARKALFGISLSRSRYCSDFDPTCCFPEEVSVEFWYNP